MVQPRKDCAACCHLLSCNYSPASQDCSVLSHETKKYLLEPQKCLFIMLDRQSMNKNMSHSSLSVWMCFFFTFFAMWISLIRKNCKFGFSVWQTKQ